MPAKIQQVLGRPRPGPRDRALDGRHPLGALPRPARRLPGRAWRARSSSRSSPTSTPRASPPASSSTARSRSSSRASRSSSIVPVARAIGTALHAKVVSNIQEIRARGARTIVIAEEGDEEVRPYADEVIRVPQTPAAARAAAHRRAAAGLRAASSPRPRAWTSTSRATSPSRSRSSEPGPPRVIVGVGIDVVDVARFEADPATARRGLRERLFTDGGARPAAATPSPRGSPPRRRWPRRSARRPGCAGPTRPVRRDAGGRPHLQVERHRRGPGRRAGRRPLARVALARRRHRVGRRHRRGLMT